MSCLLSAERSLGRLTEVLSRPGIRDLWAADALRREAIASKDLDGRKVDWEDLAVARLDPGLLPQALRPTVLQPFRLMAAAELMIRGIELLDAARPDQEPPAEAPPPSPLIGTDLDSVAADARRAAAAIDAFISGVGHEPRDEGEGPPAPCKLIPLSAPWLAAAWRRLSPYPSPLPRPGDLAALIEDGLRFPGLSGVAMAMHLLDQAGDLFPEPELTDLTEALNPEREVAIRIMESRAVNQPISPKSSFIRLLAPWLVQRSCGLQSPGPWLSPALSDSKSGYLAARSSTVGDWFAWLYPAMADGFDRERKRIAEIEAILAGWEAAFAADKRRWNASRDSLVCLLDQPVATSLSLVRQRGFSRRAAQMLISDLQKAGILHHVRQAKGREWWVAERLRWHG